MDRKSKQYKEKPLISNPNLLPRIQKVKNEEWDRLAERQRNFIDSILDWIQKRGGLTASQLGWFEKIESRFAGAVKEQDEAWRKQWETQFKEKALIIARFYKHQNTKNGKSYFVSWTDQLLDDSSFMLDKHQYDKYVAKNIYAKKVLEAHFAKPKYLEKTIVKFRKKAPVPTEFQNAMAIVMIANAGPITNACTGAKKYRVLPMGSASPLLVEERHISKPSLGRAKKKEHDDGE